jgi:hypothetical protein
MATINCVFPHLPPFTSILNFFLKVITTIKIYKLSRGGFKYNNIDENTKEVIILEKILPVIVIGMLVLSGLGASALTLREINSKSSELELNTPINDDIDQSQTNTSLVEEGIALPVGRLMLPEGGINFQIAQSFIPQREVLTKVELYIGKNTTATYHYNVAIRDNLTTENLVEISVDPSHIVPLNYSWIEFDFEDIWVTIGTTYYIVSYTENVTDNFFAWGGHNDSELYPQGCAWMSVDDGDTWSNESTSLEMYANYQKTGSSQHMTFDNDTTWDMCFKTYGRDNAPPDAPTIEGSPSGTAGEVYDYNFTAIDHENDFVYFWIVWFEGCPGVDWIGPYFSGEKVTFNHSWAKRGTYTISVKAKDTHGAESNWSTLEVTMPKSKHKQEFNWLVRYPIIQKILNSIKT